MNPTTLRVAVARGDVPCIPSPNKARVEANLKGEMFYLGKPCKRCGCRERWVSDNQCTACFVESQRRNGYIKEVVPDQ